MKRDINIRKIEDGNRVWDFIVVGGGASGLGAALDASSRGFKVLLLEQSDFTKATSSRSTKLVHGGVRYLAQGDVGLVVEALRERGLMRENAPHLVKEQRFIIANYKWWEQPFYAIGLMVYDILSWGKSLGRSLPLGKKRVLNEIPQVETKGLKGGVVYYDGQFDDSRMGINLMQTLEDFGGVPINYMKVVALQKDSNGKICGVTSKDEFTKRTYQIKAKAVVNATGIFVDQLMQMDAPESEDLVRPSQGVHLVVDSSFLGGDSALMVPKTSDGRVLFGVPWHGKVVLGTTDTPMKEFILEPKALDSEIDFILHTAGKYLKKKPQRSDVLSVFAGLRPLAAPAKGTDEQKTKEISRSHKIYTSESGLVTITGGKWTTYRDMGEDVINRAIEVNHLPYQPSKTKEIKIHGYKITHNRSNFRYVYGTDLYKIQSLEKSEPELARKLHPRMDNTAAEVVWAVQEEMAQRVEDVLARRFRVLFMDARAAIDMAPRVAALMAKELGKDEAWIQHEIQEFCSLAQDYLLEAYLPKL